MKAERLLDCDHIEERGEHLFRLACKRYLEGIVAKRKFDAYLQDNAKWYKNRNRNYSQWVVGRDDAANFPGQSLDDSQPIRGRFGTKQTRCGGKENRARGIVRGFSEN